MQPLAARSPSPARAPGTEAGNAERAPGTEAGNAERAVNLVRTFPGLHEVAPDLASQQPPAVGFRIIQWPEDRSWKAFLTAHRGGGRKNGVDWSNAIATLEPLLPSQVAAELEAKRDKRRVVQRECTKRRRALIGEVNWKAKEKARAKAKYAKQKAAWILSVQEGVAKLLQPPAPSFLQEGVAKLLQPPAPSFLQEPLPGIKQPPLPQPSFQPPPSLHPMPRSDLWTIVDMHELG
jgi:hypothetical protein